MSEIKVNKISPRTACGTTTLGDSGDTISIPAGVTITNAGTANGFGATGAVNWQTSIKTGDFTAVSGEGYFIDTSSGTITMTLPSSPAVGSIVGIKDYASSFDDNNLTINRNGSNMNGFANNSTRNTENESLTLVYADSTKGWLAVEEGTGYVGEAFITATGGTVTSSGNDKIHTFTGPGTFSVTRLAACAANNLVSYLVVAGGGSGGATHGGGGGAGGFREVKSPSTPYTASPLDGHPSAPNRITVTATDFPITVGAGGAAPANPVQPQYAGCSGSPSTFSTITSTAGGRGGGGGPPLGFGADGGSGGGGGNSGPNAAGSGNTPSTTPAQGFDGGTGHPSGGTGGGGGATAAGTPSGSSNTGGNGGAGATTSINGTPTAYAGGGGGGASSGSKGCGGAGGGGDGKITPGGAACSGTANTGGGGGGGGSSGAGGAGGSGVVIIRYKAS